MDQDYPKSDKPSAPSHPEGFPLEDSEITSLVELQKFIADEITAWEPGGKFDRPFTPITHGLGLESPKAKEPVQATPREPRKVVRRPKRRLSEPAEEDRKEPVFFAGEGDMKMADSAPPVSKRPTLREETPAPSLAGVIAKAEAAIQPKAPVKPAVEAPKNLAEISELAAQTPKATPPVMPKVSVWRMILAGLFDQVFVLSICLVAVGITSWAMTFKGEWDPIRSFSNPAFVRFAVLEFATIWLGYLTLCLWMLDMTIGMWAWGMRVAYHSESKDGRFARKVMRILCSFLFFAPVLPSVLLLFRLKGRTLLDALSGSSLYRTTT